MASYQTLFINCLRIPMAFDVLRLTYSPQDWSDWSTLILLFAFASLAPPKHFSSY